MFSKRVTRRGLMPGCVYCGKAVAASVRSGKGCSTGVCREPHMFAQE